MSKLLTYYEFPLHTRIGNKLFNLAFLYGCEIKYHREAVLPDYYLFDYLEYPPKIDNNIKGEVTFHFRHDGFDPEYVDEFFKTNEGKSINVNLNPCGQTERWWEHCPKYILEKLRFKEKSIELIRN